MKISSNPYRGGPKLIDGAPFPSTDVARASDLMTRCLPSGETPLVRVDGLAEVADLWIKDERSRMNMGSFKALGAAYVIARHAADLAEAPDIATLSGRTYVTASAGNHGLSVAAGAKKFGAKAVVYIAETVPESFADRLRAQGAEVVRSGADYAASMDAASEAAQHNGWTLLSDSSWDGYYELPYTLMEGYLKMAAEAAEQCPQTPTHVMLQAGVGGMAGAVAAYARKVWDDEPQIIVVEPDAAPALQASIDAGACIFADGPDSIMGRLDCKEPSLIALNGLARDADSFLTLSDDEVSRALPAMANAGITTTASGGAGVAAVMNADVRAALGIGPDARVLCILSEVAE
ncbi:pyridoxal-phosphate dependent enzyme [Ruegeria sp. Ofav3-42]|uniref:pyridoxal-phosphate dependent enzyme n=1 Tax=Ruegeria sp. Ofav3-42 TaxID=2917759 RepID=UPI001EF71961|nr:pyridoxal-phosphate dependent enzyme [Ruegeria sp. Ofav3-42]MCG7518525.1 pyridoxal-phosphate dependent enzyme [Ruegeria sp. Ofav3-42]